MTMNYITPAEFKEIVGDDVIPDDQIEKYITESSERIDSATFCRIAKYGWDKLTAFQQGIIKKSTARLAQFNYENSDMLTSVLSSYSINGVSMSFGNQWNIKLINGVAMPSSIYNLLSQSGLTTLNLAI